MPISIKDTSGNVGTDLSIPAGSEVLLTGAAGSWVKYTSV